MTLKVRNFKVCVLQKCDGDQIAVCNQQSGQIEIENKAKTKQLHQLVQSKGPCHQSEI